LSFWRCASSEGGALNDVVLALATAGDRIDRMDIAFFDEGHVATAGVSIAPSPGETPVVSLRDRHVDVVKLDLTRLGQVAQMVATAVRGGGHLRLTKKRVTELVVNAVQEGRVDVGALKDSVRDEVTRLLG